MCNATELENCGQVEGREEWRMIVKEDEVSFRGDKNVLKLDSKVVTYFVTIIRTTELHSLKSVNFMVYELYLNKTVLQIFKTIVLSH